jgi:hypothetical protein
MGFLGRNLQEGGSFRFLVRLGGKRVGGGWRIWGQRNEGFVGRDFFSFLAFFFLQVGGVQESHQDEDSPGGDDDPSDRQKKQRFGKPGRGFFFGRFGIVLG